MANKSCNVAYMNATETPMTATEAKALGQHVTTLKAVILATLRANGCVKRGNLTVHKATGQTCNTLGYENGLIFQHAGRRVYVETVEQAEAAALGFIESL